MGFVNERLENHEWQTIDRERGIVLKGTGGMPQEPFDFNLNIAGENVNFSAHRRVISLGREQGCDIEWQVLAIYAPSHVKQDKLRLHSLITEALDVFGFATSRKNVKNLTVTFAPNV
ncbi:hypothetical protein C8R34_10373 [Nitrosomonas sp. Nm84]|uniref:hypothetical protein n=1 Tax=Nitrosomonas sp. Nm84 TaxID=200124 RepID=UPI000D76EB35|nr:hypothetical protein [Nitrosomonas sp. Nm84]PXW89916.1 hypothetical protein C8R34_10373 [Nitrosomonas sp. Nm84]